MSVDAADEHGQVLRELCLAIGKKVRPELKRT